MHIIHKKIGVPKLTQSKASANEARFVLAPLPAGFGVTLANSLRRVMLSSIPGSRVTGVKIAGATHEYMTLPGIKDSVLDIVLNLKGLIIELQDSEPIWIQLNKRESGVVTAADIITPTGVEIKNLDLYITEIDPGFAAKNADFSLSIRVEKGTGYLSTEALKVREEDPNVILVDANFSPVVSVTYDIHTVRSGEVINLDSLDMSVKTTGSLSPDDAMKFATNMLQSYFHLFNEEAREVEPEYLADPKAILEHESAQRVHEAEREAYTPIEILGLSPRTLNALVNGEILSIEQLTKCTEAKLGSIKGFGRKAMTEVRDALAERGLKLF